MLTVTKEFSNINSRQQTQDNKHKTTNTRQQTQDNKHKTTNTRTHLNERF